MPALYVRASIATGAVMMLWGYVSFMKIEKSFN